MKKLVLLFAILLLITACGKEEAPKQQLPQRPDTFYVPPPAPAPLPIPELTPPIIPEPEQIPEPLPPPKPLPPIQTNTCQVLTKTGTIYTLEDVDKGKISMQNFSDLNKCYPYFSADQANTEAMCCII